MGIIFDIKRFAIHDGPGIRTTIFMKGCPLACSWCHNPESIGREICKMPREKRVGTHVFKEMETVGREITVDELMTEVLREKIFMDESGGGVTFSGGEPLYQPEFLLESLKACADAQIHTVVDTSGYASTQVIEKIAPFTNLFLFDLKLIDDKLHRSFTGVSNVLILRNFDWLLEHDSHLRVRIPIIPGVTDSPENLTGIATFLKTRNFPWKDVDLLPFHATAGHKYASLGLKNDFDATRTLTKNVVSDIKTCYFT
jgi:pyruvate formate lyase activating enzyme